MGEQRLEKIRLISGDKRFEKIERTARSRQAGLMVIMEDVYNPYNLGAIARSCDAFGVQDVTVIFENQDVFDPREEGLGSALSASKWLDYRLMHGTQRSLKTLKAEGWYILATVADRDTPTLYNTDLSHPQLALLVGNEHAGVSDAALQLADSTVTIPMQGMIESFNVSVATAIMLYEITRQRRKSPHDYTLSESEALDLMWDFSLR